ncbi:flagellar hook-associated protein FlgK [Oxalobacteraceae bacterium R-40]|uniref:Flagellar hook-associated protein 1 n=1 Tax=Keguizhuia sedimenti TaxID=3064264 RepID=A0ABU1BS62_9BURK|nr:flagellar hook-associated protein FlgK [Oxalobacteraceae bacterium R-40]
MTSSILNVGKSALAAAQVGLTVTGHNIANASTPGYTRQIVTQSAVAGEDFGYGFVGKGTEVTSIERAYNEYLNGQLVNAETSRSQLNAYYSQIQQINTMLADAASGISPTLQNFFKGVHDLTADPASRQSMLSSAETLVSRFQSMDAQFREIGQGVNSRIESSVGMINVYAEQIATLNDAIEKAQSASDGKAPNDLLDQRDLALAELSKEVKVTVIKQGQTYNVFMGNGQPLVVNTKTFNMSMTASPTDPTRLQVAYTNNGKTTVLAESAFAGGGNLGGLFEFRSKTLDVAQNTLGRIATVLGATFNAQHRLGQTETGALGQDFFKIASPLVSPSTANTGSGVITATLTDAAALKVSDYRVQYVPASGSDPAQVKVTRLSDGNATLFSPPTATIDGVEFTLAGTPSINDDFLIRPVAAGASSLSLAITDKSAIAAALPVRAGAPASNAGTGKISGLEVSSTALMSAISVVHHSGPPETLTGIPNSKPITVTVPGVPPTVTTYPAGTTSIPYTSGATINFDGVNVAVSGALADNQAVTLGPPTGTLTYDGTAKTLTGFPPNMSVTVQANGVATIYAPGTPVPYTEGAKISYGGIGFTLSGAPSNGDTFTVSANTNGIGDRSNALLLANLQTSTLLDGGTMTYQGAYSQLVNAIGNKTRELEATSAAADKVYDNAMAAQQAESGVNLDEEATNLIRYQQAYQAAAKVMQTASQLFDVLLELGR